MKTATSFRQRLPSFRKKTSENPTVRVRSRPERPEQSIVVTKRQSSIRSISASSSVKPKRSESCPNVAATTDENDRPEQCSENAPQQEQSRRVLTHQEKMDFDRIDKAALALDKAGNELFERGEYSKAMTTYTRALKLKRRILTLGLHESEGHKDLLLASVATSINNIGYLRQRSGASADEAMAAYRDALQIKREILGNHDLSVGKTLNNIGSVYFSTKNWDHALEAYLEAKKIMVLNLGNDHMDVATVLSNIGDVHMAKHKSKTAKKWYSEALRIRWTVFGDHDPKCVRLLEKIASIDMAGTPEKMRQSVTAMDVLGLTEDVFDKPVHCELQILRTEVGVDIQKVESIKRTLALDMVKDKLQVMRDLRMLQLGESMDDESVSSLSRPLTPVQRTEALSCVKDRLARIREYRLRGEQTPDSDSSGISNPMIDALRAMNLSKRNLGASMEHAVSKLNK